MFSADSEVGEELAELKLKNTVVLTPVSSPNNVNLEVCCLTENEHIKPLSTPDMAINNENICPENVSEQQKPMAQSGPLTSAAAGNMELINDSFFVFDEESDEAIEMTLKDIDNLLLLFFHTVTMEAFELIVKLVKNSTIPGNF